MNQHESGQTFEAARKRHLIEATIEALADVGFKAASLSQIARRAHVSTGLFAHYFGDKDGLLEATLRFMAARLHRATIRRLRAARTARERLYAVADSALAEEEFDRRTSAVWLAFWGQITHSTRYQRVQSIYQQRMLANLRHDLRTVVEPCHVETYASMIAAMIDGLWIRSHAAATQPDGANARRIVHTLIDGLIAGARADRPAPSLSKGDGPPLARVPRPPSVAQRTAMAALVERAGQALVAWRETPVSERQRVLRRCATGLLAGRDGLARLDASGTGRAWSQTADLFVPRAARIFERCSTLVPYATSERLDFGSSRVGETAHEPIGLVACRGHWSAPIFDACRQAAPALAFGNAMIFQPAEAAAPSAERLVSILREAGVPDGLFSLLRGGEAMWLALAAHPRVLRTPFVESTARAATVVFRDADLEAAAESVLCRVGRWRTSPDFSETPLFVERDAVASFVPYLTKRIGRLRTGDPLAKSTALGHAPSRDHRERVLALVDGAVVAGATVVRGGRLSKAGPDGRALPPTIVTGCVETMPLVQGGVFAPVVPVLAFDDEEDLIARLGAWGDDLSVGLFLAETARGRHIATRLRARLCCINDDAAGGADDVSDGFEGWGVRGDESRLYRRTKRMVLGAGKATNA